MATDEQRYKYMHGGRYGDRDMYLIREQKMGADPNYAERRYRPGYRNEYDYRTDDVGVRGYDGREVARTTQVVDRNIGNESLYRNRDYLTSYGNVSSPAGGIRGIDYGHDLGANRGPTSYRTTSTTRSSSTRDYDDADYYDDDDYDGSRNSSGSSRESYGYSLQEMRRSKTGRKKWTPLCDMGETDKYWVVRCEIPGVKKEKLSVQIEGKDLIIRGKRVKELWNADKFGSSSSLVGQTDSSGLVTTSASTSTTVVKSNESGLISKEHKASETNEAGVTSGTAASQKKNPDGTVSSARVDWVDKERGGRGVFKRKIRLPARVEQSAVQALYKDGILEVLVRKPEGTLDKEKKRQNRVAVN